MGNFIDCYEYIARIFEINNNLNAEREEPKILCVQDGVDARDGFGKLDCDVYTENKTLFGSNCSKLHNNRTKHFNSKSKQKD
jgi:hypothetical protein